MWMIECDTSASGHLATSGGNVSIISLDGTKHCSAINSLWLPCEARNRLVPVSSYRAVDSASAETASTLRLVAAGATLGRRRRRRKHSAAHAAAAAFRWRLAPRSDALQVRDGQSARAARQSTPPHPSDIKPTILCGLNLIPCCSSRDMDFNARKNRVWNKTTNECSVKRFAKPENGHEILAIRIVNSERFAGEL